MILDKENRFSNGQAVTTTAISTNVIDLHKIGLDLGTGEDIMVEVVNKAAINSSGSAVCVASLVTDDADTMGTPTVVQELGTYNHADAAGTRFVVKLQPGKILERYLAVQFVVSDGPLTGGTFDAYIVKDADLVKAYPSGFSIA